MTIGLDGAAGRCCLSLVGLKRCCGAVTVCRSSISIPEWYKEQLFP